MTEPLHEPSPSPVCKHCGAPIVFDARIRTPCLQWRHAHGAYGCNARVPSHSETFAEPKEDQSND